MIKIKNIRTGGSLFHYAHFICDCLFPEIISDFFNYKEIIREKNIHQTIGNFSKIYSDVMRIKNTELLITFITSITVLTSMGNILKKRQYSIKIHWKPVFLF
jgi:hypothetical protein